MNRGLAWGAALGGAAAAGGAVWWLTRPHAPQGAPTGLQVSAVTPTQAQVRWAPVATATQYTVVLNGGTPMTTTSPSLTLTQLQPLTTYHVTVQAQDAAGTGPAATLTFTTPAPVPGAVSGLRVASVSATGAQLAWDAVPYASTYDVTVTPS